MSRSFWVIASDGSVVQKTEEQARMLYQAGYLEPVQLVGGDGQWVDADTFGLRELPQAAAAPAEPRYWVVDPGGAVVLKTKAEAAQYYVSGYDGLTMVEGSDAWVTGIEAGVAMPPAVDPGPVLVTDVPEPAASTMPTVESSATPWEDPIFHTGFAIIDTETGGLSEQKNPLLSVAVVLANEKLERIDGFSLKAKPPEGSVLEIPVNEDRGKEGYAKRRILHYEDLYTGETLKHEDVAGRYIVNSIAAEVNGFVGVVTLANGTKDWDREPQRVWMRQAFSMEKVDETYVKFLAQTFKARPLAVAHNAKFDEKYVRRYLPNLYAQLHPEWFCTYRTLSGHRKARGESVGKGMCTLEAMAKYANYINDNPHEALADAETCLAGLRWLKTTQGA